MAVYKVGSSNDIQISAFVDTEGIAKTSVFQKRGSASKVGIAESDKDSGGNIPTTHIGNSISLINSFIIFITSIDLSQIDKDNLDSVIDDTEVIYTFSGGPLGQEDITPTSNDIILSDDKRVMTFIKIVDMLF
ncbi:hypothetical protein G8759_25095 [Spirosoma aureum]|uniref:Uncharacterized protein n=1 Tax=Spirosoma aureum TaxID=2692134 RepID=A0A6G9ATY4_9BACT|nr:hypothetical protein [Spirosoma aureum]QIP15673.1 hypothetical protein G8759_25095 [Spirosoma aureum]